MERTMEELDNKIQELIPQLQRRAQNFLKDKDDADELFQETFLKIWANRDKFTYNESLKAWCYAIMYNTFVDSFNSNKKKVYFKENESEDRDKIERHSSLKDYNTAESSMEMEEIHKAIDETLKGKSNFIVKHMLAGYKHAEIGDLLGISENSAKQQYFHAVRKLREVLKDKFDLDDKFGDNINLVPIHKIYQRRRFDRDIKHRKKFEND
jgi:RNA polymerase sigma factor (sigma-70 family)